MLNLKVGSRYYNLIYIFKRQKEAFQKRYAQRLLEKCPSCGEKRIENLFDRILGLKRRSELCVRCRFDSFLVDRIIQHLFPRRFSKESLQYLLSNPLSRRAILGIIKGVAVFGLLEPQPAGIPVAAVWNFTNMCNLNCLHCYQDSSSKPSSKELDTDEALAIVRKLSEAGVAALNFGGGEPLLRQDFFPIAEYSCDQGLYTTISTNGTLITKEIANKLGRIGVKGVDISLDGAKPETHDLFRGTPGSFMKAVEGIRNCAEVDDLDLCINTTLTKNTLPEIPEIIELVEELGATRYYVSRILPVGRGRFLNHLDISKEERVKVLQFLSERLGEKISGDRNLECLTRGMTYFARVCHEYSDGAWFPVGEILTGFEKRHMSSCGSDISDLINRFSEGFSGCATALTYCGISPEGDVLPCAPAANIKLGNLKCESLEEIWTNHKLLNQIRKRSEVHDPCGICSFKGICGGCRVTAYGDTGDWLGPDTSCPFDRSSRITIERTH